MHTTPLELLTNRIGIIPAEVLKALYWLVRKPSFLVQAWQHTIQKRNELLIKRRFVQHLKNHSISTTIPAEEHYDIAVVMVSHNDLNSECLASLQMAYQSSPLKIGVIIVDNASTIHPANELVRPYFPHAWVLLRNGDFGFGRSMNRGARQVRATTYFILNPDTILTDPSILTAIHQYLLQHPDVGLIGPRILNFQGELQDTCRRFPAWYQPLIQRTFLKKTEFGKRYLASFLMKDVDHTMVQPVDWVQGSAMGIPGSIWDQLSGFDDRYWMYFEDMDLCRRIWKMGKRVLYFPSISIQHAHIRQSAQIQNLILNILKTKETRAHLMSWMKYLWKWS